MRQYSEIRPLDAIDHGIIVDLCDRYPGVTVEDLDVTDMRTRTGIIDDYARQVRQNWPDITEQARDELGAAARQKALSVINQGGSIVRLSFAGIEGDRDFWPEVEKARGDYDVLALQPSDQYVPTICSQTLGDPIPLRWVDLREQY